MVLQNNTFDIAILNTKFPYDRLIPVLNSIIDFCFKESLCKKKLLLSLEQSLNIIFV